MGTSLTSRLSWSEICSNRSFRGRWVALDDCRYDERTSQPAEGTVIDADDDLGALCNRMKQADRRSCAILFCQGVSGIRSFFKH